MNDTNLEYLVYGMCIMFHLMMGWVFICRKQGLAKKLIGLLMLLVAVQYAKDLVFLPRFYDDNLLMERIASSIDIVTVPLYVLILIEFCRPGWLSKLNAILLEAPFLLLSLLYMLLHVDIFFKAMVVLAIIYGVGCALWTLRGYQPPLVAWSDGVVLRHIDVLGIKQCLSLAIYRYIIYDKLVGGMGSGVLFHQQARDGAARCGNRLR